MTDQEKKWEEEFEEWSGDVWKPSPRDAYLQACKVREEEIESLIRFIPIDSQLDSNTMIHLLTGLLKKGAK